MAEEKHQPKGAIERFWRQVLVSAINEELDRMAASHGLQVFYLGFLAGADSYQMGVPSVPLADLYSEKAWARYEYVKFVQRAPVRDFTLKMALVHRPRWMESLFMPTRLCWRFRLNEWPRLLRSWL